MKILIYGLNFSPELTGIGKYTGEMAAWLADRGHTVRVITTPPYYPAWEIGENYSGWKYNRKTNSKLITFRCPLWVPKQPSTFTRIIHHLSFTLSSMPVLFLNFFFHRPDVIICIAPSFISVPQAALFSKLARVKSWLQFQDFEICAMFGSGMATKGKRLNQIIHKIQSFITRRFDTVSTISNAMCASATEKNVSNDKIMLFPNWVDTDFITPDANELYFRNKWNINTDTNVILYSGNLGKKQGLEILVDAANALRHRHDILFVICGDGVHKTSLIDQCRKKRLENVQFHSLQPYNLLPNLLRFGDIHLIIQKHGTADAVLPSKLTSIFSVGGHAIITAERDTELGHIVSKNPNIATLVKPENAQALTTAITTLSNKKRIRLNKINEKARDFAIKRLNKETILSQFERDLIKLIDKK